MTYTETKARELVVKAGLELIEKKLIARTWGNISARISDTEFVITPSGRAYESLRPKDLVKVNIQDLSSEGPAKPSSEKGIHAACYALRPDCGFVIHTHQFYASAVCAEEKDTDFAPCAKYALPGTEKLKEAVRDSIAANPGKCSFLMAKHGALCLGKDYDDAFGLAQKLEDDCRCLFENYASDTPKKGAWLDDYAQMFDLKGNPGENEDTEAVLMVRQKNEAAAKYVRDALPIALPDRILQHTVYSLKYSKLKDR